MPLTIAEIEAAVAELDERLPRDDEAFRIATLLLAALNLASTDPLVLARFTGLNVEWIGLIRSRLIANEVWDGGGHTLVDYFDEQTGGTEFWMMVAVGRGYFVRSGDA